MKMIIDTITAVGFLVILACALMFIVLDGFTIRRLRSEKEELRRKLREASEIRLDEVNKDADRHKACMVEVKELEAQLKMANVIKDGWRSAAEKNAGEK